MRLKNKNAIVTGGGSGIGQAIALGFSEEGARIIVADINADYANSVAMQIQSLGKAAIWVKVDVASSNDAEKMAQVGLDRFGMVDILVNCAGGPSLSNKFFHESTEDDWNHAINMNLKGVCNCSRAVINHMIKREKGRIINISSTAGMIGEARGVAYSAAKAGIIGFTMALAKEVACYGINVNCISPGPIMSASMQKRPERIKMSEMMTGLGRIGKPEEVAALAIFLASDEAGFITGQNYPICGLKNLGFHAGV